MPQRHYAQQAGYPIADEKKAGRSPPFPIPKLMQSAGAVQDHGLAARMQHAIGLLFLQYTARHFA